MVSSPAVSPQVAEVFAAKAKALTVLANAAPSGTLSKAAGIQDAAGADLSEQLNRQIKQKYVKDKQIGEGTYAAVFSGHVRDEPSNRVAIKKIKVNAETQNGIAIDAIREIKFLQELSHPNIIALYDVFTSKNQNVSLVLEFLPGGDLEQLIGDKSLRYGLGDMKAWMGMITRGVWWLHENFILHRDIKPNNLFIAATGEIKLADFGLARSFAEPYLRMTHMMITRWYRPLELFFGAPHYSGAVDIWSVGCVFAEISLRVPFIAGASDPEQVVKISEVLGAPTEKNWPGVSKLPLYVQIAEGTDSKAPAAPTINWAASFANIGPDGQDLLRAMLQLNPQKRISAKAILEHRWFTTGQKPTKTENLPRKGGGAEAMANEMKRPAGELEDGRGDKVAKKLDFGALKK